MGHMPLGLIEARRGFWTVRNTVLEASSGLMARIARLLGGRGPSADPYARVPAPKRPLLPRHSARIALAEPFDQS